MKMNQRDGRLSSQLLVYSVSFFVSYVDVGGPAAGAALLSADTEPGLQIKTVGIISPAFSCPARLSWSRPLCRPPANKTV